jgi:hypothetical protein
MNKMKKTAALIVSVLFVITLAGAQCLSGDCQDGKGIIIYPDGERYVGQFFKGRKHGEGTLYYLNGSRYRGQWANDLPHGEGFKLFKDGTRLEGYWEKGRLIRRNEKIGEFSEYMARGGNEKAGCISGNCHTGKGIYIYSSGAIYVGEFRNGEINGFGVCYFSDGSKYQGEWVHRYPEGHGIKTYPDGSKRTGWWKQGQPVDEFGNLVIELINSKESENDGTDIQSGCISGNCTDGQGLFAYPDGSRYEGQFYDGKPEGWGTFYDVNGDQFTGSFQAGYRHGNGKLHREDGRVITGEWRHGEYVGPSARTKPLGCLDGDCENGYGTYRFKDSSEYVGTFRNFLPHGEGVVYYSNGERYEGEMARGAFNGEGTLYRLDGSRISGRWENGTFLGVRGQSPPSQHGYLAQNSSDPFNQQAPRMKVWAVIIGIAAYNHMPVLRYTDDDAYRIYAFLKSPEGGALDDSQIRILIDEDATKHNIVKAMEKTFGQAGPNDLVFLYFSGHGLKGSFLPFDFDGYNNKLFHTEINHLLDQSPAKYKLCIADACHSGSLLAMRSGEKQPPILLSYYESLAKAEAGTALIMSSKSDETSLESSGLRQGVFSHFLIRGLKGEADTDGNKIVSVQELFDFVRSNVRNYTASRQSPMIQGDYDKTMTVSVVR